MDKNYVITICSECGYCCDDFIYVGDDSPDFRCSYCGSDIYLTEVIPANELHRILDNNLTE